MKDDVNKLFTQFKNKDVIVDLRGDYQTEGKVVAIDNYLNIVLENDNGLETIKGGNIILISIKEWIYLRNINFNTQYFFNTTINIHCYLSRTNSTWFMRYYF